MPDVCTIYIRGNLQSMTIFEMRGDGESSASAQVGANKVGL